MFNITVSIDTDCNIINNPKLIFQKILKLSNRKDSISNVIFDFEKESVKLVLQFEISKNKIKLFNYSNNIFNDLIKDNCDEIIYNMNKEINNHEICSQLFHDYISNIANIIKFHKELLIIS